MFLGHSIESDKDNRDMRTFNSRGGRIASFIWGIIFFIVAIGLPFIIFSNSNKDSSPKSSDIYRIRNTSPSSPIKINTSQNNNIPKKEPDILKLKYPSLSDTIDTARKQGWSDLQIQEELIKSYILALSYYTPEEIDAYLGRTKESKLAYLDYLLREQSIVVGAIHGTKVFLRQSSSRNSEPIIKLDEGTPINILSLNNEWCQVKLQSNKIGWIHIDYIQSHLGIRGYHGGEYKASMVLTSISVKVREQSMS